jgi:enamine deaminase RidA (YjgF/YER057c/UK114 family)
MTPEQKLDQMGIELPMPPDPVGAYVSIVRTGELVFTAGQLPLLDGSLIAEGKVPSQVSVEQARTAARQAAMNALGAIRSESGSLDNVRHMVRVHVYVNSDPDFTGQADVANGASELLEEVFGAPGRHTRCAVGVAALPLNAPVEVDLIAEAV